MIARRLSLAGGALALLLPGCMVEQRDFQALKEQVRLQQKQIQDLKARQEEQGLRIDNLNNGFKILGDKAEESARRIDELAERGAAMPAPLAAAPPPAEPPAAPAPRPAAEEPVLLSNVGKGAANEPVPGGELITAGPKAEKLYAGALALYSGRDYRQALAKFQEFVSQYPDHKLASNAQYWIGECNYSLKRYAEAAEEFGKVEKAYPGSHKIPAALLKKAFALAEIKKMPEAQATLQRIIDKYGQSEEATKARERLERWKQP